MLLLYRGHWLLLLCDKRQWWCEITEMGTAKILPTAASAQFDEGPDNCVARAKVLVDRYCHRGVARYQTNAAGVSI
jgi:hypothetical protein